VKGHYSLRFKTRAPCNYLFIFTFTFSLLLTAGAITASTILTFRKLTLIIIKESLSVGKACCIAQFPCDSTALVRLQLLIRTESYVNNDSQLKYTKSYYSPTAVRAVLNQKQANSHNYFNSITHA